MFQGIMGRFTCETTAQEMKVGREVGTECGTNQTQGPQCSICCGHRGDQAWCFDDSLPLLEHKLDDLSSFWFQKRYAVKFRAGRGTGASTEKWSLDIIQINRIQKKACGRFSYPSIQLCCPFIFLPL